MKAKIPFSRPAANQRAPQREPRWRELAKLATTAGKKEATLGLAAGGESVERITRRLKLARRTIDNWRERDPEFASAYEKARALAVQVATGRVDGLLPQAVDVMEETMGAKDPRLRWDVAYKGLKGRGVLQDTPPVKVLVDSRVVFVRLEDLPPAEQAKVLGR